MNIYRKSEIPTFILRTDKMEIMDNINEWKLWELIALLREHCRKHYWFKDNDVIDIDHDAVQFYLYFNAKRYFSIGVEKVISKEFWFIKFLVDNDKIDLLRLDNRIALSEFNKVERVLMALAISDTPIDDLISYLR